MRAFLLPDWKPSSAGSGRERVAGEDEGIAQEVSVPMNRVQFQPGMSLRESQARRPCAIWHGASVTRGATRVAAKGTLAVRLPLPALRGSRARPVRA